MGGKQVSSGTYGWARSVPGVNAVNSVHALFWKQIWIRPTSMQFLSLLLGSEPYSGSSSAHGEAEGKDQASTGTKVSRRRDVKKRLLILTLKNEARKRSAQKWQER